MTGVGVTVVDRSRAHLTTLSPRRVRSARTVKRSATRPRSLFRRRNPSAQETNARWLADPALGRLTPPMSPRTAPETRYVALLRGVSPMNAKMAELKRCFEDKGFAEVKTVLASGNVIFTAPRTINHTLEAQIESAMRARLERSFLTIVRPIDGVHLTSERTGVHVAAREDVWSGYLDMYRLSAEN